MSISIEEVDRIAHLARLEFSDAEKQKLQQELSSILEYVEQVQKVAAAAEDTIDLEAANIMRDDVAEESSIKKELISHAPSTDGNFVKVKSILE